MIRKLIIVLLGLILSIGISQASDELIVDVTPDTINVCSNTKWIDAEIILPEGYSSKDVSQVSLTVSNGTTTMVVDDFKIAKKETTDTKLVVKFPREALVLVERVPYTAEISVTIGGETLTGTDQETLRVIRMGRCR
jgi:hypothetical protein